MNRTQQSNGQGHHLHYLPAASGSFALLSPSTEVDTAVVFVHGFGGDASGTWSQFQLGIDEHPSFRTEFAEVDLFFFQYQAVWESINSSIDRFVTFVNEHIVFQKAKHFETNIGPLVVGLEEPEVGQEAPGSRRSHPTRSRILSALPSKREYRRLILVAHSEGGVVVRQAILNSERDTNPKPLRLHDSQLGLFAPALFGYSPSGLLGTIANFPGLGKVLDACLRASPAYRDLKPGEQTDTLRELRKETELRHDTAAGFRARLLWGRKDRILKDGKYTHDSSAYIDDLGHIGICKPTERYDEPLKLVASLL